SRDWQGTDMQLPSRRNSLSHRARCFLPGSAALSCDHTGRFKIWANGFAGDNTSWHAQYRAVAGNVRNHQGICADHNVVPDGNSTHHFTTRTEINIVAKCRPARAADASDADALVNGTTMADLPGEDKDAIRIVDYEPWSNIAFAVYMDASDSQTNRVDDQVNEDHQLADYGNFNSVNPATEPMHDYR